MIVAKILLKKVLDLGSHYWVLGFKVVFILISLFNNCSTKKQGGKKDSVWFIGFNDFEMVFLLVAEIVVI